MLGELTRLDKLEKFTKPEVGNLKYIIFMRSFIRSQMHYSVVLQVEGSPVSHL